MSESDDWWFEQVQLLSHPLRIGVLGLLKRDPTRSLSAADLLADLTVEDPDAFGELSVGQIAYHRARLRDANFLPEGWN